VKLDGVRDRVDGETERVFEVDKGLGLEEGKGVEGRREETDMRAKRLKGVDGFDAQTELEGDARREILEGFSKCGKHRGCDVEVEVAVQECVDENDPVFLVVTKQLTSVELVLNDDLHVGEQEVAVDLGDDHRWT
jgi:hypothetical protein